MGQSDYVHLDVKKILRATEKAFLVRLPDDREEWIPFSQMADSDDYAEGDEDVEIAVTEWIARTKNLL